MRIKKLKRHNDLSKTSKLSFKTKAIIMKRLMQI